MKNRIIIITISILCHLEVDAYEPTIHRKWMITESLTFAPSVLFSEKLFTYYVNGYAEFFPEENVAVRGDYFLYVGDNRPKNFFRNNHALVFGVSYFFNKGKRFAPYVSFQPGMSITKLNNEEKTGDFIKDWVKGNGLHPLITASLGFNYYIGNHMHVFARATYVEAFHVQRNAALPLREMKFAAGLGFNMWVKKKANRG